MVLGGKTEVRPRTTGEILDDAWRLYLADAPLLLTLSGLFIVPAALGLLCLLLLPAGVPVWVKILVPALTAVLLTLTGLGSGACQEVFFRWAEDKPAPLGECLKTAWRRGLAHVAAQALMLLVLSVSVLWLFTPRVPMGLRVFFILLLGVPGLLVWIGISGAHAILAGRTDVHFWSSCLSAQRATRRQGGKALLLLTSLVFLLAFAVLNLHFLIKGLLSLGEDFLGFNTALANLLLSLSNPIYMTALILVAWWLLAPFVEAVNYLFHLDCQVRYFGLDLWYRLDRFFPALPRNRAGAILLAVGAFLLAATPAQAQAADRLTSLRSIRQELGTIIQEVQKMKPYSGGHRWIGQLSHLGNRLNKEVSTRPGGFDWFGQALAGFEQLGQDQALRVLRELDDRLALVERSLKRQGGLSKEDIKKLVPEGASPGRPEIKEEEPKEIPRPPRVPRQEWQPRPPRTSGPGWSIGGGFVKGLLILVIILVGAALVVALVIVVVLNWPKWRKKKAPPAPAAASPAPAALEAVLTDPDEQNAAALWGEADALARKGMFLEALRTLYLAVLVLLHRANLIRYERTRTNHEYARQLRPQPEVHKPFKGLTSLFELKWYGERACQPADYDSCRGFAVNIQGEVDKE
jgi:hypothetical protein